MSRALRSLCSSLAFSPLGLLALLATGCPNTISGEDAGTTPGDDDAGARIDAGVPGDDAGAEPDAGPEPDAGDPGDDAGPGDAGCVTLDPCEGVPVSDGVRFESAAASTNAFGPGMTATLVVGQATRADVEAAFGAAVTTDNPFRGWHCAHGIRVEYVDDLSGDEFEGNGSAGDVVARVITLPGVELSNGYGVTPGQSRSDAQAALTDPVSVDLDGAGFDASASDGLSVVSDASGAVTAVALFKPQAAGAWDLAVDVPGAAVGTGATLVEVGDALESADAALGTGWDAQGIVEINAAVRVLVRVYASYGIRLAALCPVFGGSCDASSADVQQIILSPPFVGVTAGGLGLGDAEGEFTTAFGAGEPSSESEDLLMYTATGGEALGVAYVRDSACERRAAALVLNYTEPP